MNQFVKAAGEAMNGKTYRLDGISGTLRYREYQAIYPCKHTVQKIEHEPDANGKRTVAYQERKRQLGDDWVSDLTNSERLCEVIADLEIDISLC